MGLPFVPPYLSGRPREDFASGANFAVGGAMALAPDFFGGRGVPMGDRMHFGIEMKWFHDLLDLLCPADRSGNPNLLPSPSPHKSYDLTFSATRERRIL